MQIDNLEIAIKSEVSDATKSIDTLIGRINELSSAIKSINVSNISSQISKLTTSFKSINSGSFSEVNKSVKETENSINKVADAAKKVSNTKLTFNMSDYDDAIERLAAKFSEAGREFKVSGNLTELEKQSSKLSTELDKLFQAEQKIISVGRIAPNSTSFENLQYNISKTTNELDILREKISQLKSAASDMSGIQIIRGDRSAISLEYLTKELSNIDAAMQHIVSQSHIDTFVSNLETGLSHLRQSFPEQTQLIEEYKNKIESLKNVSVKIPEADARNSFKGIPEAARDSVQESQKILNETMSHVRAEVPTEQFRNFTKEIAEATAKLKELEVSGKGMGSDEWEKAYLALAKIKNEAKEYKNALDRHSKGLDEDIQKTDSLGNHVEELKKKLDELKSKGLNFGDTEFDKAYSELQKVEGELSKYKSSLTNTQKTSTVFAESTSQAFKKIKSSIGNMVSNAISSLGKFGNALTLNRNNLNSLTSGMSGFKTATSNTISSVGSLTKQIAAASGVYLGLYGIIKGIRSSIDFASSLTEAQNVINVTFGKSAKVIEDFTKTSIQKFGLSELAAKQAAGRYQAMGTALGFPTKQMANMSVELTKLSADMASFYNVKQTETAKSLQSVFTGTVVPMNKYGVNLKQATLEEWLHKKGIDAKIKSMSQMQQAMVRYQYIMENTSKIQGDFERTSHTWHNQLTLLKENFRELSGVIGTVFINSLKPVVQAINAVMGKTIDFSKTVLNSLGKIFGWTYQDTGKGIVNDFADEMEGAEDLSDGMDDVADSTEEATKKQKEFNKQLAKFDELTNYTTSEKGGKDKSKDDKPSMDDLADLGSEYGASGEWKKTQSIFKEFESELDTLYKLGDYIGQKLTKAMESIPWDSIYEKARGFGAGLASFLNGLISPELFAALGKTVAGAINTALHTLDSFGETFDWTNLGDSLATGLNSFLSGIDWKTALSAASNWGKGIADTLNAFIKKTDFDLIGETVANFINTAVRGALKFVDNFNFAGAGKAIAQALNSFIKKTDFNAVGSLVAKFVNGVVKSALTLARNFDFKGVGKAIATFINASLGGIKWKTILTAASAWGKGIAQAINSFFKETDFTLIGSTVGNFINTAINFALSAGKELNFKEIGSKIADGINSAFATIDFIGLAKTINTWVKGALTAVVTLLQKTDFEAIGQKIGTFLAELDILSMMGEFAQMLWEAIKAGFSLLGGLIQEAPIETVLIAAFAAFQFLGVGSIIASGISKALVKNLAAKLGVELLADTTISNVLSTALSTKLAAPLQDVANKIGAIAPAIGVAVGSFVEFNVVAGAFEHLTTGTGNFIVEIGKIAGAVALAVKAFTAAFGFPAGTIIAAIAGTIGAIKGINDGLEEIHAEETADNIKEVFTNPGGTPISELADDFSQSVKTIGDSFNEVSEKSNKLDTAEKNIENIQSQIQLVEEQLKAGTITTEEAQEKFTSLLSELDKAVQDKFSSMNEYIVSAFGENGVWAESFESAGVDVSDMVSTTLGLTADLQKRFTKVTQEMSELDPTSPRYKELQEELYGIIGGTDDLKEALNNFDATVSAINVDYSGLLTEEGELNPTAVQEFTSKISSAVTDTQKDIEVAGAELKTQLEELIDKAKLEKNQEAVDYYEGILERLPEVVSNQKLAVAEKGKELTDTLEIQLVDNIKQVAQDAKDEWAKMNPAEKLFAGGSETSYVESAIRRYQENYITPISSEIESSMSKLGVKGAGWASDSSKKVIDSLFVPYQDQGVYTILYDTLEGNLSSTIDEAIEEVIPTAKQGGKTVGETISNSVSDGIDTKKIENDGKKAAKAASDGIKKGVDKKEIKKAGNEVGKTFSDSTAAGIDKKKIEKAGKETGETVVKSAKKEVTSKGKTVGTSAVNTTVQGLNENWKKVDNWSKNAKMPEVKFVIEDVKSTISSKWKEVTNWWGDSRKLAVNIDFKTTSNDVSEWWNKVEKWWGTKKLEVENDFKTVKSNIDSWWKKITGWWGTKKLEVNSNFKTTKAEVDKWWNDKIKKWWGTKKLEVDSKFITEKKTVTSWWTDKVKSWWGNREVKIGTKYTTSQSTVNGWGKDTVNWLKEGISGAWGGFSEWVVKKIKGVINQVVKGLNWVLKQVGSSKKIEPYAKGSSGLPKDTVGLVNDQAGSTYREMIVPPHGKPFIPKGRNIPLPMEKGTKIMPAKQTKEFMQSMKNIPHFAKGTGDFTDDIFNYFDKPEKIIKIAADKFLDFSELAKASLSISKGVAKTLEDGSVGFIKKIFESTGGGAGIERAISWALKIAADDSHGYDQNSRWGNPDYDCSSFVISAFEQAGIKLKSAGATYTGDMRSAALRTGFTDVTKSVNLSNAQGLRRGDILLDEGKHVALYLGDGQLVHASINEHGRITGGQPGDQTGREILTRGYYNHPWNSILRYTKGGAAGGGSIPTGESDTSAINYTPSAGVAQWRDIAIKALQLTGQYTPQNLVYLLEQMRHESDGNPNDVNTWDINAKRGTPSKGLMQVIDPTFKEYAMKGYDKNIFDPLSNIIAAIRYTVKRYGSLYAGWAARGYKGYASGIGTITLPDIIKGYASGGFPSTGQMFVAREDGPELVGNIGNSSAVVNNDQIVESVAKGVKDAILSIINVNDIISWITTGVSSALQAFSGNGGNIFAENSATAGNGSSVVVGYKDKVGNADLNVVLEQTVNIKSVSDKILDFASFTKEISSVFSSVKKGLKQIIDDSTLAMESLSNVAEAANTFLQEEFEGAAEWTKTNIIEPISKLIDDFAENINDKTSEAKEDIQTELSEMPSWIEDNVTSEILSKFTGMFEQIISGFSGMWSEVTSATSTELENIFKTIDTIKDTAIHKIGDIIIKAESAFSTINKLTKTQSTTKAQKEVNETYTQTAVDVSNAVQEVTKKLNNSVISTVVASVGKKEAKKEETDTTKDKSIIGEAASKTVKEVIGEPAKITKEQEVTGKLQVVEPKIVTEKLTSVVKDTANTFVEATAEEMEKAAERIKNVFQGFNATSKIRATRYATGIGKVHLPDIIRGFAKGGLSKDELGIVNDQAGSTYKELIIPPNGEPFIPEGRNVPLYMKKGTKIISADKTKKFLKNIPHFASGTEDFTDDKKSEGSNGIVDGIRKVIDDIIVPYMREIIRTLNNNASSGTTLTTSNKKTTTKYSDTVKEIQKAWNDLAKWFENTVVQPIEKQFESMKEQIVNIFDAINEDIVKNYEEYSKEWQETLKEIPEWIGESISDSVLEKFQTLFSDIQEELSTAWSDTQDIMTDFPDWVETNVTSSIFSKFTGMFEEITTGFTTMWSDVAIAAEPELTKITNAADEVILKVQQIIKDAKEAISTLERVTQAQKEAEMQAQIKQTTTNIANAVQEVTNQLGNSVISTAVASIGGFSNNLSEQVKKQEETKKEQNKSIIGEAASKTVKEVIGEPATFKKDQYETAKLQSMSTEVKTVTEKLGSIATNVIEVANESMEKTLDRLKSLSLSNKTKVTRYATGGFPEDGWFRASHGEIMGQFDNGQSVVANNQQITDGIADAVYPAVYNAMMAAMASSSDSGDIVVQIDGENVFRAVRNKDNDFFKRTHKSAFEH